MALTVAPHLRGQRQAIAVGQVHVQQHDIDRAEGEGRAGLGQAARLDHAGAAEHRVGRAGQHGPDQLPVEIVVLDEQDPRTGHDAAPDA